ncbi:MULTISPECIES: SRPBCC family protein [Trichocoleus]|uniref:SRPBCC family protein n=1 Tax=Trichocoleus desertorum GB2-A4 TaxID=2933944 RepID=A0ABV0JBX7_9CYAN|nr:MULTISPECIES: SRPBCC family protein [unclassified Trichocoleus]MBD1865428.1 SRPBCC family protein [Trichocoleus sp. FACHB-46]MBD2095550.1 SRPBCC family protein [Trichocoleus sp. FACHB-591]MBD2120908.1 SRPBCC family protein [Trichocoleus sp. FACHB-262]
MSIHVERSIRIDRSPQELYQFWRNFENLPRFMNHLESVKVLDEQRSHWITKAPLGNHIEWDAEITQDQENELICWRSLPGSNVPNEGCVSFRSSEYEAGTEVKVTMDYSPFGGMAGAVIATFLGEAPDGQLYEDLWRLKQEIEGGNTAL